MPSLEEGPGRIRPGLYDREGVACLPVPWPTAGLRHGDALHLTIGKNARSIYLLSARIGHACKPGSIPLGQRGVMRDPFEILRGGTDLIIVARAREQAPLGDEDLAPHRIQGQLNAPAADDGQVLASPLDLVADG